MVVIADIFYCDAIRKEAFESFEVFRNCESVFGTNEQQNVRVGKILGELGDVVVLSGCLICFQSLEFTRFHILSPMLQVLSRGASHVVPSHHRHLLSVHVRHIIESYDALNERPCCSWD